MIVRACPWSDVACVRTIVREGLDLVGHGPLGRTPVRPNLVVSGPRFTHAHTRAELFEGVLLALRDSVFVPHSMASADLLVNCPRFKAHPWTPVPLSMKTFIGCRTTVTA